MKTNTLGSMTLGTLLILILAGMGFSPANPALAASMPAYEVLPPIVAGVVKPFAVATDGQGRVYVADTVNNRVGIYSRSGALLDQITGLTGAKSVAVDDAGLIYVGSQTQQNVKVLAQDHSLLRKLGRGDGEFTDPSDIDFSGGLVYVSDKGYGNANSGAVKIYDGVDGSGLGTFGAAGNGPGQLWHPTSLAFDDASSEIVILDRKQIYEKSTGNWVDGVRIQFFTKAGEILRGYDLHDPIKDPSLVPGQLRRPVQLTVDAASRVYVSDAFLMKVVVYDNANAVLGNVVTGQESMGSLAGLALSSTGRLYVASIATQANKIHVFGIENFASMDVQPVSLSFTAIEGDTAPAAQDATLVNSGKTAINWTASTTTDWVNLPTGSGTIDIAANGAVPVEVQHDGLAPGSYQGSVQVTATGMSENIAVTLTVNPNPLQVSPGALSFAASAGSTPSAQVLSISNGGSEALNWSASADQAWLDLSKTAGTAPNSVKVYADTTGLVAGNYDGTITFLNPAGGKSVSVAVSLSITEATAPPVEPPDLPQPGSGDVKAGGKSWRATKSVAGKALRGVWGSDYRNVLAVGDGGTILSYNGKDWRSASSGTESTLQSVWGALNGKSLDIYAVGNGGTILHSTGSSWNKTDTGTGENLMDVWGLASEFMAIGGMGSILNVSQANGSFEDIGLRSIWGSSAANVFAVGEDGTVLRSTGAGWTIMVSDTSQWLNAVWGDPATGEVFAVGENGAIIRYNGTNWSAMSSGVGVALHGVFGTAANDVYAVGDDGVILHYDGSAWNVLMAGGTDLHDIWVSDRLVVAVGDDGMIYTGRGR